MTDYFNYVVNHMDDFLNIGEAVLVAASLVVALTPTKADDGVVDRLKNILTTFKAVRLVRR